MAAAVTYVNREPRFHQGTGDPAVTDDSSKGFKAGDMYHTTSDEGLFICLSAAIGAANWDEVTKT